MRYRTQDGEVLEATSLQQLAEILWQTQRMPEPTMEDWMRGSARRAAIMDGSVIRTCDPVSHVEDLIRAGYIECLD